MATQTLVKSFKTICYMLIKQNISMHWTIYRIISRGSYSEDKWQEKIKEAQE